MIPTSNPPALIGYYLAVFSLIRILGAPLGLAAFGCGFAGLRRYRRDPAVHGRTHAWVAVILGGLCGFGHVIFFLALPLVAPSLGF